jgi:hypothetical protein
MNADFASQKNKAKINICMIEYKKSYKNRMKNEVLKTNQNLKCIRNFVTCFLLLTKLVFSAECFSSDQAISSLLPLSTLESNRRVMYSNGNGSNRHEDMVFIKEQQKDDCDFDNIKNAVSEIFIFRTNAITDLEAHA